jgi:protein-S-isoprenylcysteine O-methyltransferase Ste14
MILLELDPNVVRPGWTALVVTLLLAAAMVLLYFSMRKQFRNISIPRQETDDTPSAPTEPTAGTSAE